MNFKDDERCYSRNYGLVCNLGKQMAVSAD